jgi:hypothetical protein
MDTMNTLAEMIEGYRFGFCDDETERGMRVAA